MRILKILVVSILLCFNFSSARANLVPVETFYLYDKHLPLNAETVVIKKSQFATTYEIFFDSVNNQRVSGLLVIPNLGLKKYPVILYLHGSGMSREIPDMALPLITQKGLALFSISAFHTNERKPQGKTLSSGYFLENRQGIIQTIIDYRRGLDVLSYREDIDMNRVGIIGLSLGTVQGSILFGVDERIKVSAFAVGGGDLELMAKKSILTSRFFDFGKINYDTVDLRAIASPVDPVNFAKNSKGRPTLMVNGRKDEMVPAECAKKLYENFQEPKHIMWYDGGHVPPMDIIMTLGKRALAWFENYLIPERLLVREKNVPPQIHALSVSPDVITQGNVLRLEAKANQGNKQIIFVKAYLESDDAECLLYDDGKAPDKKALDGIFTGRCLISYNSRCGETKITATAVDYQGEVSSEISTYVSILPYQYPPGAKPPVIEKVKITEKVKIGDKIIIEVEISDENDDVDRVEANVLQFGLPALLERVGTTNMYRFEMEIPNLDDLIVEGKYDILISARDKTHMISERKIVQIYLEK